MQNQFCRRLSNSLYLMVGDPLLARPCCYMDGGTTINSFNDILTHYQDMSKIVDYESAGNRCNQCLRREQSGYRDSLRYTATTSIPDNAEDKLTNLELQIDKECNAACIMCSDTFSTQWATQTAKFNPKYKIIDQSNSVTLALTRVINRLDLSHLTNLKLLGGEPFYTDTHKQILLQIPNYQNLKIQYVTNGSIFPDKEILKIWENCKKINLVFSIDGIDEHYNYVRWPLRWHQVENNIRRFLELKNINFNFYINITLNPLNVYYLDSIEHKIKDIFQNYNYGDFEQFCKIDIADYTRVALSNTPESLKQLCYKKYGIEHRVSKMLKGVIQNNHKEMVNWLDQLDQQRDQTPWRQIFSEVVEYYE